MSVRLIPYVNFPGNGAEVIAYYQEIFGGEADIEKYGDMPMDLPFDPPEGALAHGRLTGGDVRLAGGDSIGEPTQPNLHSDVYSFLVECDSVDEASLLIEQFLSSGASEAMPFEKAPWGDHYGQVKDRYGVLWAFNVPASD